MTCMSSPQLDCGSGESFPGTLISDITLATPRGDFATTLFGHQDTPGSASKMRPVLFMIHGAGMSRCGFTSFAEELVCFCSSQPESQTGNVVPTAHGNLAGPASTFPPRQVGRGGHFPLQSGPGLFDPTAGTAAPGVPRPSQSVTLELRCLTIDLRAHGETTADEATPLSMDNLVSDMAACIKQAMKTLFSEQHFFYLIGHSLGGAIVTKLAHLPALKPLVAGIILLDIVEDTAKGSLQHMDDYLAHRPVNFGQPAEAVKWFVTKGGMRNRNSANKTVPSLLRYSPEDELYHWRTNLQATSDHWEGWFDGMDDLFVTSACPKVLCLANTQRLDTKLTVAHMQGKFQFEVIGQHVGHYLHEDDPLAVARKIGTFLKRVESLTAKLPPPAKLAHGSE